MKSILIILLAVLTTNGTQAQEGEPKEKNFLQAISFKHNEVFKRFGVFASANVLYYHSNLGLGFDCFLVKSFSANVEIAVGESFGQEKSIYIQEIGSFINLKHFNSKANIGFKYWPITKKTKNNIYPIFGVNIARSSVYFERLVNDIWEDSVRASIIMETPVGLCYYKDGFKFSAHAGAFIDFRQGFTTLSQRSIYPFMSFQFGYRF
jgi:hypothetical protein